MKRRYPRLRELTADYDGAPVGAVVSYLRKGRERELYRWTHESVEGSVDHETTECPPVRLLRFSAEGE